jgi:hypothetical protein
MAMEFNQAPAERGKTRKVIDKVGRAASYVTLPLGLLAGGGALLAGEYAAAAVAGTGVFLDATQIRERKRRPDQQSWYNPERIMDKIWSGEKGRNKFNQNSTRMAMAAA